MLKNEIVYFFQRPFQITVVVRKLSCQVPSGTLQGLPTSHLAMLHSEIILSNRIGASKLLCIGFSLSSAGCRKWSKAKSLKAETSNQCGPDETSCPCGCCPEFNWYCCQDDHYCASTAAGCPFLAKRTQLTKLAKSKQCGPDETSCPNGCCPEFN